MLGADTTTVTVTTGKSNEALPQAGHGDNGLTSNIASFGMQHDHTSDTAIQSTHGNSDAIEQRSPESNVEFNESTCLFCDLESSQIDDNLIHMSKAHGLHIDRSNLLVEVHRLVEYFHLVIHDYHECLYCGKERGSLDAIRQHMFAKGHCKYDILDENSEFRDFYDFQMSDGRERLLHRQGLESVAQRPPRLSRIRPRTTRDIRSTRDRTSGVSTIPPRRVQHDSTSPAPSVQSDADRDGSPSLLSLQPKSTRAQKQDVAHDKQLSRLRTNDRRSLIHLPVSQQRSILATYHSQLEGVARADQTQRTRLETAGNHFGRLDTIRLVRKPPHYGHVVTLNR